MYVCIPSEYVSEQFVVSNDRIQNIISKYQNILIKLINDIVTKGSFSFNRISLDDVKNEIAKLDVKKASLSSSIPLKFIKDYSDICSDNDLCFENLRLILLMIIIFLRILDYLVLLLQI